MSTSEPQAVLRELGQRELPSDLAQLGLLEAAAHLRRRSFSALELLRACEARIEAVNGGPPSMDGAPDAINAWVRLYPELAEHQASEADRRLGQEGDQAPLVCGIPIGLKDVYGVAGLPLTASSRVLGEDNVPAADCSSWARLRAAGMVLVGHLHTHEFACGGTCDQVGNPWQLDRTAGGSSGGSAAALAAGMVPAATGTDTAGSIRIPSAMCGVSGIKPTTGRIPIDGVIPLAHTFDTLGPLGRSVADCSALLAAMCAGPQVNIAHAVPATPLGALPLAARGGTRPLAGRTIAITDRFRELALEADVEVGYQGAQEAVQKLGARLVELPAPVPAITLGSPVARLVLVEMWSYHRSLADRAERYRPWARGMLERAREPLDAGEYAVLQRRRGELGVAWRTWMDANDIDLILEPTARVVAFAREDNADYERQDPLADLTFGWNATGHPVVALPAGLGPQSGLPTSVSLIARRGREADAIQAALDLQADILPPLSAPKL
ncbi:MAG: amidase [Solirubrobacteraceae bacterium]